MDNESKDRLKRSENNESPQSVEELKQQIKEEQEKSYKYEAEIRIAEEHRYYHNSHYRGQTLIGRPFHNHPMYNLYMQYVMRKFL